MVSVVAVVGGVSHIGWMVILISEEVNRIVGYIVFHDEHFHNHNIADFSSLVPQPTCSHPDTCQLGNPTNFPVHLLRKVVKLCDLTKFS